MRWNSLVRAVGLPLFSRPIRMSPQLISSRGTAVQFQFLDPSGVAGRDSMLEFQDNGKGKIVLALLHFEWVKIHRRSYEARTGQGFAEF